MCLLKMQALLLYPTLSNLRESNFTFLALNILVVVGGCCWLVYVGQDFFCS